MKSSSPLFHPLFLLSFLPSVVYASPAQPPAPLPPPTPPVVNPQPPITPTTAVHDRALSAPSITTIISTTTESSVGIIQWINPRRVTYFTTKTVTTLRPVLSTATSFPTTITETAISTVTYSDETTYLYNPPPGNSATAMAETGTKSSFAVTVPSVWVVHTPSPSLLGVGEEVPCGEGYFTGTAETEQEREKGAVEDGESRMRDESEPEDERCEAKGMRTGCQGQQCIWEEGMLGGTWWCYLMSAEREYVDPTKRMGRACWGNPGLRYMQLGTPCSIGDMDVGCVRGRGRDVGWGAVYWEGD